MGTHTVALQALLLRCVPPIAHLHCRPCTSLVSFRGWNFQNPELSRFSGLFSVCRKGHTTFRTFSRRRNIFLHPQEGDNELSNLYGSGRFNDDNDDSDTTVALPDVIPGKSADFSSSSLDVLDIKLPAAHNVRVRSAEFIKSSVSVKDCPSTGFPEFAIIGRSNVGKSSLINLLTGRSSLAMVSKTPGKTRCINHFLINGSWYLVDLPGYGYARTSKDNVLHWNKFTREYFLERESLVSVLLLVDASIPPMELDLACAAWLAEAEVPMTVVYTKMDKKKKGCPSAADNIASFEERLLESWEELPPTVATSSRAGTGKGQLLAHIARLRALYNTHRI